MIKIFEKIFAKPKSSPVPKSPEAPQSYFDEIKLWLELYASNPPWLKSTDTPSLNLPASIAADFASQVTLEFDFAVSGTGRGDFIDSALIPIRNNLRRITELACAGGGVCFKPCIVDGEILIDIVSPLSCIPLKFSGAGTLTSAAFIDNFTFDSKKYTRVETHTLSRDSSYTIDNKLFIDSNPIPLSSVPMCADLNPHIILKNIESPLFSYFPIPIPPLSSPTSPLGSSVYSRAVNLIRDADLQYQRLIWEFEGGELALDVSEDLFDKDRSGHLILPNGKDRLFRPNKLDSLASSHELIQTFSPTLRDCSIINGLNTILKRIEDACGLARGSISDPASDARTATEIRILKQRSFNSVLNIQSALKSSISALVQAINTLASVYTLAPHGTFNLDFFSDDSILTDNDSKRDFALKELAAGVLTVDEYRLKYQGHAGHAGHALSNRLFKKSL